VAGGLTKTISSAIPVFEALLQTNPAFWMLPRALMVCSRVCLE
jgi:hypothetical protein